MQMPGIIATRIRFQHIPAKFPKAVKTSHQGSQNNNIYPVLAVQCQRGKLSRHGFGRSFRVIAAAAFPERADGENRNA